MKSKFKFKEFFKQQIVAITISIAILVFALIGTTYAVYIRIHESSTTQSIESGDLSVSFTSGNIYSPTDMTPMLDSDGLKTTGFSFTIENTGTIPADYQIRLSNTDTDNLLDWQYIRYSIDGSDPKTLSTTILSETEQGLIYSGRIKVGETLNHVLKVWVILNETDGVYSGPPDSIAGQKISLQLKLSGIVSELAYTNPKLADIQNSFANKLLQDNVLQSDLTVPGLHRAPGNSNTYSYIFRGKTVNNYVSFGSVIWRVLRITENGGIKLILDNPGSYTENLSSSYTTTSPTSAETFNYYQVGTLPDVTGSKANQTLSTWLTNWKNGILVSDSISADDYLEDSTEAKKYNCSDTTLTSYEFNSQDKYKELFLTNLIQNGGGSVSSPNPTSSLASVANSLNIDEEDYASHYEYVRAIYNAYNKSNLLVMSQSKIYSSIKRMLAGYYDLSCIGKTVNSGDSQAALITIDELMWTGISGTFQDMTYNTFVGKTLLASPLGYTEGTASAIKTYNKVLLNNPTSSKIEQYAYGVTLPMLPVILLKNNITYESGTGTEASPYIINIAS